MTTKAERVVQGEIMLAIGARPFLRIWRQNVGKARSFDGRRVIDFGPPPGAADLSGVLACGRRLEIECKAEGGRLSIDQRTFRNVMQEWGAVYFVARSVEDAEEQLASHLQGCKVCRTKQP